MAKIRRGENDLATLRPGLASQWHPILNEAITPADVTCGSHYKAYWQCDVATSGPEHIWQVSVDVRTQGAGNCPFCANKRLLQGFNDLATVAPQLTEEWHPELNESTTPHDVMLKSKTKIWWQCRSHDGHVWRASIIERGRGTGCPYCSNRRVLAGSNDIATTFPRLAEEWHPYLNSVGPTEVAAGSTKKFWWRHVVGESVHEWEATPQLRSSRGRGCPYCSGNKVLPGFNDLETVAPGIASEWNQEKNGSLTPKMVSRGCKTNVWWICSNNPEHEWRANVNNRFTHGAGCPSCAKHGFNPGKDSWLYLLRHPERSLFQVGISNVPEERLQLHSRRGWVLVDLRGPMNGHLTRSYETGILRALKGNGVNVMAKTDSGLPSGTQGEAWHADDYSPSSMSEVLELMHRFEEWCVA